MQPAHARALAVDEPLPYQRALARGLAEELRRLVSPSPERERLLAAIASFERECQDRAEAGLDPPAWRARWQRYGALVHAKAALLNAGAEIAQRYESMEEFWADADAQLAAASPRTFWDTYEHGRRRGLEAQLARIYGAPEALLLNSGMSAVAVALGSRTLRSGARLLTGERSYFETTDYLERFVRACGIEVVRAPIERPGVLAAALRELRPEVALLETVTNVPSVPVARGIEQWSREGGSTFLVIDNSAQGHLTRWSEVLEGAWDRALVVESGTKYLTQECMAGVVYGGGEAFAAARHLARATGQQLQEKAFSYLCEAELERVGEKLARHSSNARAFAAELREAGSFALVHTLDSCATDEERRGFPFGAGVGALVFLALSSRSTGAATLEARHREVLRRWRARARAAGLELDIRAGFGWINTSARVYESSRLNQDDAPCYLRVSLGVEPTSTIRALAAHAIAAAREVERQEALP